MALQLPHARNVLTAAAPPALGHNGRSAGARRSLRPLARPSSLLVRSMEDPFRILGVEADADEKQLKTAYRRLALKYHPDLNKEEKAEAKFKALREAYELLLGKGDADRPPAMGSWEFHDWYWSFTMRQRQARSGDAAPPAAPPLGEEHRGKVRSQVANLKRRAAARRQRDAGATDAFASPAPGHSTSMHSDEASSSSATASAHSHSQDPFTPPHTRDSSPPLGAHTPHAAATPHRASASAAAVHAAPAVAPAEGGTSESRRSGAHAEQAPAQGEQLHTDQLYTAAARGARSSAAERGDTLHTAATSGSAAAANGSAAGPTTPAAGAQGSEPRDRAAIAAVTERFALCMHSALDSHNVALQALHAQLFPRSTYQRATSARAARAAHSHTKPFTFTHGGGLGRAAHTQGAADGEGDSGSSAGRLHSDEVPSAQRAQSWGESSQQRRGRGSDRGGGSEEQAYAAQSRGGAATATAERVRPVAPADLEDHFASSAGTHAAAGETGQARGAAASVSSEAAAWADAAASSDAAADGASERSGAAQAGGAPRGGFAASQDRRDSVRSQLAGLRRKSAIKSRVGQSEE